MLFYLRKHLLSALLPCVLSVSFSSALCYAQTEEVNPQDLTLLQDINTAITADSEGFAYDTLTALSETLLGTDNPLVELATFTGELTAGYSGAKLSNNEGLSLYLALNSLSETHTVSYEDEYSIVLGSNSVAIRLIGFEGRFAVDDFGGELILDGSDFSVQTTIEALSIEFNSDERLYLFTDAGLNIDGEGIFLTGVLEVEGTDADDTFDFSELDGVPEYLLILNGQEGSDSIVIPNTNTGSTFELTGTNLGHLTTDDRETVSFISIENLIGSDSPDTFNLSSGGSISGLIYGGSDSAILIGASTSGWASSSPQLNCDPNNNTATLSTNNTLSSSLSSDCHETDYSVLLGTTTDLQGTFRSTGVDTQEQNLNVGTSTSGGGSFGIFGLIIILLCLRKKSEENKST